jgi:hypothetical protein
VYDLPREFNQDWVGKEHTNEEMVEFEAQMEKLIRGSKYFTPNINEATHFYVPVYAVTFCGVEKARKNENGCYRSR